MIFPVLLGVRPTTGGRDLDVNLDHLLDVYMANPDARNGAVGEAVHNITRQQGDVAPVVSVCVRVLVVFTRGAV